MFTLGGKFDFLVSTSVLSVRVAATFSDASGLLPTTPVVGDFVISPAGLVGALQMGAGAEIGLYAGAPFGLSGQFQLELNTTNTARTIQVLNVEDDGTVFGFKSGEISLELSNTAARGLVLEGHLTGSGGLQLGLPRPFGNEFAGATATLDGAIELNAASASVALTAAFTFSISVDFGFFDITFTESFSLTGSFS